MQGSGPRGVGGTRGPRLAAGEPSLASRLFFVERAHLSRPALAADGKGATARGAAENAAVVAWGRDGVGWGALRGDEALHPLADGVARGRVAARRVGRRD